MSIESNIERLRILNSDSLIQNFIAQANARYILFNTYEDKANFPAYTIDDDRLNFLALYYLEIGCKLAENQDFKSAAEPLEKGAAILEYVHGSESNRTELSNYYLLIAALAYYASFQYSKSFILTRKAQSSTLISKIIGQFLQRNFAELVVEIEQIVVDSDFSDKSLAECENEIEASEKLFQITIAKSLNGTLKYYQTGDTAFLDTSESNLEILKDIAQLRNEPSIWWLIRILSIILGGLHESSLWNSLGGFFKLESSLVQMYIKSLVYLTPKGITELFITQRKALSKVLNSEGKGCIITLPTSSGKTRIAEIAILDCVIKNPESKILYIAPFRSLAFEIEHSLGKILSNIDITVSHLYGGSLFNKLDEREIEESNVIIATPEKAKAIFRGDRSISDSIKLIVIDEGHLLGADKRLIVNEIFTEELRFFIEKNAGRFLLLSAVLPNAEDLSLWLTKSAENTYKGTWRPSDERLGMLEWTGNQVNLNWINSDEGRPSFNNKFIVKEQQPLKPRQRKIRYFPSNKNEAIASTTYKLRHFGTALIYVGMKKSVFTMADAYLKCLGIDPDDFKWSNTAEWKAYELACIESYGENNNWLLYARKGILCHHGALNVDVRLPLERLMRNDNPLVIISTSTLGQGVNLGVSTVVFSTIHQYSARTGRQELISTRDFWNIAGRAGRAYVDQEAKILIALDKSNTTSLWARQKIRDEQHAAQDFFKKEKMDNAMSGILALVKELKKISEEGNIEFDLFLQLIMENRIEELGESAKEIDSKLDWIDDTLLALHENSDDQGEYAWVDSYFRNSLAYIQLNEQDSLSKDELIGFFDARVKGVIAKAGTDRDKWKSIIQSSIPLNSNLFLENSLSSIIELIEKYSGDWNNIETKSQIILEVLALIKTIPVFEENEKELASADFDNIIKEWLLATPFSSLCEFKLAEEIISKLVTYKLPWIFNGISKKLRNHELLVQSELFEELSVLLEVGLPDIKAVKIYQAGIRSRTSANEIASTYGDDSWDKSIRYYKNDILSRRDTIKTLVSKESRDWIDLLFRLSKTKDIIIDAVPNFSYGKVHELTQTLIAKEINGEQYLISPDFKVVRKITAGDVDFSPVNNIQGVIFKYNFSDKLWKMVIENPYVRLK